MIKHFLISLLIGIPLGLTGFFFVYNSGILDGKKPEPINAYVILSGSMEPELPVGSVVISQSSPTYNVGDIITFKQGEKSENMVTHRIVSVDQVNGETVFTTKGDNNEENDNGVVPKSSVTGKSLFSIPYLGEVVNFAKTPQGFVALIVVPATIVIYEELKTILREIKTFLKKIIKRGEGRVGKSDGNKAYWRAGVVMPIAGFLFILTALSTAYFTDIEKSLTNVIGIATTYGTDSPPQSPTPSPSTEFNNVVINEFMANPETGNEWVELYNPTNSPIDLTGWTLSDEAQAPKSISSLGVIPANGHLVFEDGSAWLNNTGDTITLYDENNVEVDSYIFILASDGVSIGRETDAGLIFVNCLEVSKGLSNNNICVTVSP